MKKSVRLIIIVMIVAALAAAYILVLNINKKSVAEETTAAETITIDTYDADSIKKITVESGENSFEFEYTGGKWVYGGDPEYPLRQSAVKTMVTAIADVTAVTEINPEAGELADYGLEAPQIVIKAVDDNGEEHVYNIGDLNSFNGNYYLNASDRANIWMVKPEFYNSFNITVPSITENDTVPKIESDNATDITIGEKVYTYSEEDESWNDGSGRDGATVSEEAAGIINELNALTFTELAGYGADTDEELAEYGLDEASRTVIAVDYYQEQTIEGDDGTSASTVRTDHKSSYCVSIAADGISAYVMLKDSNLVYRISADKLKTIAGVISSAG